MGAGHDHVDQIEHELVREAMYKTGVTESIEITFLADIPAHGSGLGSSSSLTVGALNALYAYQGINKTAEELAQEACQIEIDILGKPIGKQDQYSAAYGNCQHIRFKTDDSVMLERILLREHTRRKLNSNLLLFYTCIQLKSSEILAEQKQNIDDKFEFLYSMKPLVAELKELLLNHKNNCDSTIDEFGRILYRGWMLKRNLAGKITSPVIDETYDAALKAGALGGKVLGAGGGVFFLFHVLAEKQDNVREALRHLQEFPFSLERDGSKTIFNIRR